MFIRAKLYFLLLFLLISSKYFSQDIFEAARNGDIQRTITLIKINPDTIHSKNANGFTPLIIAGYRNQIKLVEFLLEHNVDINASSQEGAVILGACYKGNLELAKLLIKYKADVNACNQMGTSALMYAALSNNIVLVKLLLKHGAKKELVEKSGKTALSYAKMHDSGELIALLSE